MNVSIYTTSTTSISISVLANITLSCLVYTTDTLTWVTSIIGWTSSFVAYSSMSISVSSLCPHRLIIVVITSLVILFIVYGFITIVGLLFIKINWEIFGGIITCLYNGLIIIGIIDNLLYYYCCWIISLIVWDITLILLGTCFITQAIIF